jgi:MalT-like TPR region
LSQDALKATHEALADFYNLQLEKKQRLATQDVLTDAFSEENFHRSQYLSKDEYQNWLLNDKYKLLKFLQLRGEAKFLDAFLSNVTDHLGLEALNIRLVSIHIDVVHLGGSYKKAVNMIQEYLSQHSMAKILNSDELLHLFIRKIHHQMFYMPVPTLIQELLSIESEIDKKDLPARYNELLFMIGGNLGILSGDFRSSRRWLVKSIRFAKEHDFSDCLCRTLRKYSDLLRFHNHLDAANFFCNLGLDLAKDEGFKRYEIYLSCSKAEIFREKGLFHRAAELYRSAHDAAKQQGIKGWVAHTYLGFSECALALGNIDDAKIYLARANTIYKEIEQAWGLIQVGIGFSRCLLLEGDDTWMKIANNTLKRAEEMVYAKDISFLRSMIDSIIVIN